MRTKTNDWLDPQTRKVLYGIDVLRQSRGYPKGQWCHAAENGKPLLFETAAERDAKRRQLQRTKAA